MPKFLDRLRLGLGVAEKPGLKLKLMNSSKANSPETASIEYAWEPIWTRLPGQYLQHIIRQVESDGYYVESLNIFRYGNLEPSESIAAIERWAAASGLKVSFNYDREICFFENN